MNGAPQRLCIVNPFHEGGGAEFQIQCLLSQLVPLQRFKIYYLARHVGSGAASSNYTLVRIGSSERAPRFGYLMDALPLYRALRQIAPDVIYQRVAGGYTGICAYYARRHRVPMIWHVAHDSDVVPGVFSEGRNPLRPYLEKRSVEYAIPRANRIVVQKAEQRDLLRKHYGREADLIVPNFHPEPSQALDKTGPALVVWVANLKRWKQPEIFVRLARALQDMAGVRFVMAGAADGGSGNQQWSAQLMRSIEATPNLEYIGRQSHEEINALLARAHVFVNTSVHEGFPNTFIQAWMRAVPVVSLNVDPDGVLARENVGIHAETEARLIASVRQLLMDPALRVAYGDNARRHAMSFHSVRNASSLVELIQSCTAGLAA